MPEPEQLCLFCGGECARQDELFCMADDPFGNVVHIANGRPVTGDPIEVDGDRLEAVTLLEDMVEQIRAGVNVGFVIVMGCPVPGAADYVSGCTTAFSPEAEKNPITFIGGLDRMKHRLQRIMDWDEEEDFEG